MTEKILQSGGGVFSPEKKKRKKINSLAFKIVAYLFLVMFLLCVLEIGRASCRERV